jgi:steroid delta-isomerase-like uncharacterized protein
MGTQDIRALLDREQAAWNAHDPDGVIACYAEDAEFHDIALPEPLRGRQAMRDAVAAYLAAFSDLHVEVQEPIVDGDRAAQEWRVTGTHDGELMGIAPTGRSISLPGCGVAVLGPDGLLVRGANYWNAGAMLQQLGVIPEAAAAAS